jgi:hypothetical protein
VKGTRSIRPKRVSEIVQSRGVHKRWYKNGCVPLRLSNQAGWVVGLGKGLQVSQNRTQCVGDGFTAYGNRCYGYNHSAAPCGACCAANDTRISAGFVETEEDTPVTITAYRGEKAFKVYGVIEDSIASKVDREGNVCLSFETLQSKDAIGYIPCIDWYTTDPER